MSKQDINGYLPLTHCLLNNESSSTSHKSDIHNHIYKCRTCKSTSCTKTYKWGKMRHGQLYCERCATKITWIDQSKCLIDMRDEENEKLTLLFHLVKENPTFVRHWC